MQKREGKAKKKVITVAGDEKYQWSKISTVNSVKIESRPVAITTDLLDCRKKPGILILYTGTNNHGEDLNTINKAIKLLSVIKEIHKEKKCWYCFFRHLSWRRSLLHGHD